MFNNKLVMNTGADKALKHSGSETACYGAGNWVDRLCGRTGIWPDVPVFKLFIIFRRISAGRQAIWVRMPLGLQVAVFLTRQM